MWQVSASVGYERNEFTATESSGPIYGVGFIWRPSQRTNVVGDWEHRFFGSSYQFSFDHATPLSVWSVQASRSITSYPQQFATVPGGVNIAAFLNNLFVLRVPDAADARATHRGVHRRPRLAAVDLGSGQPVHGADPCCNNRRAGAMGLIGARNSVFVNLLPRQERTDHRPPAGRCRRCLSPATTTRRSGAALVLVRAS